MKCLKTFQEFPTCTKWTSAKYDGTLISHAIHKVTTFEIVVIDCDDLRQSEVVVVMIQERKKIQSAGPMNVWIDMWMKEDSGVRVVDVPAREQPGLLATTEEACGDSGVGVAQI